MPAPTKEKAVANPKEKPGVDLKATLEAFAGHKIDATEEQIEQQILFTPIAFSNYSFTPMQTDPLQTNVGEVVSRSIIVILPPTCAGSELLDVSGIGATNDSGVATLLIKSFVCPSEIGRFYSEPVITVATPSNNKPSFLTITHSFVIDPVLRGRTDVQINVFSWDVTGKPAPDVPFNFRCRVPTSAILT